MDANSKYTVEEVFEFLRYCQKNENEVLMSFMNFCFPGIEWLGVNMRMYDEGQTCSLRAWSWNKAYDFQYKKTEGRWHLVYSSAKRFWLKGRRLHECVVQGLLDRKGHAYQQYPTVYLPVPKYVVPLETLFEGIMVTAPTGAVFVKEYATGRWSKRTWDGFGFFEPKPVPEGYESFLAAIDLSAWPDQEEAASLSRDYLWVMQKEGRC